VGRFLWVPFAVALAGFVLPFATVSCGDVKVEPSGADLVLRSAPEPECVGPDDTCPDEESASDFELDLGEFVVELAGGLATAAFLGFVFALVLARIGTRRGWTTLAAAVGVASLVFLGTRDYGLAGSGPDERAVVTESGAGYWLALGGGALGALAAGFGWIREGRQSLRPFLPVLGAGLLLLGYLLPWQPSEETSTAYADLLDLRHPWLALFGVLMVAAGLAVAARRRDVSPTLASLGLGILVPAGVAAAQWIWRDLRVEGLQPGLSQFVVLAGAAITSVFAARQLRSEERSDGVRGLFVLAGAVVLVGAAFVSPVEEAGGGVLGVAGSDDVAWHVLVIGVAAGVVGLARQRVPLRGRAFVAGLAASAVATGLQGLFPLTAEFDAEVASGVWATLAGGVLLLASCVPRRGRAGRQAGPRGQPAPAPGSPPPGRSAPGSGGSPPAAP
jgi:hypothetical protein